MTEIGVMQEAGLEKMTEAAAGEGSGLSDCWMT